MARKTVSNLKDSLAGILTGLNLNNVQNIHGAMERTARELATRIYIPDVMAKQAITMYDGVFDYVASTDIFGSGLVDFRVQGIDRNYNEFIIKQPIEVFDRTKAWIDNETHLAFEFVNGVGRVRIVSSRPVPKIELDPFTATTGWVAAGSASGITLDQTVFWQKPGSLRFLLTGISTGTLTKTIPSVDLTDYVGVGVIFLAIRTPLTSDLSSISVKIGSNASNYYSVSATKGFLGAWTAGEWLLVALDLAGATTVGTPVNTAITYAQISITHAATLTNFYIGDFWISLPSPHDMFYQTAAFFQASGSNPSQTITNDNDSIILNDAAYVIYEYECAQTIASQQGGGLANGLVSQINEKLNGRRARNGLVIELGLYDLYRGNNPSQELRQISNYYDD